MPSTTFSDVVVVVLTVCLLVGSKGLDVLSLYDRLFKSMDVVGPNVDVMFLLTVEIVEFVADKCWVEL